MTLPSAWTSSRLHDHVSSKVSQGAAKRFCFFAVCLVAVISPLASAVTGLDFPGSAAVSSTMRFRFMNPLPIYPATYIWCAYPRRQTYYYTTFFWGNDDGRNDLSTFLWDNGNSNTFYGAHPYPIWPNYTSHKWEIATDRGGDFLSNEDVVYDRWYTQALVVWSDANGRKHTDFYWDLPDTHKVVSHTTDANYGNKNPPVPALTFGDASWNPGKEVYHGILRGLRVYSTNLSVSDILSEAQSPLSTTAGVSKIWYLNMNPSPADISDKSGAGHHPSWVGSERPSLYTASASTPCDLNGDQSINAVDLQNLANAILRAVSAAVYDLNRDGKVDALDLQTLANVILGKVNCP